jgi:hypothetical protein
MAIVIACGVGGRLRLVELVISGFYDFINLAIGFFLNQVMDFFLGSAGVGQVLLAVHIPGISSAHEDLLLHRLVGTP